MKRVAFEYEEKETKDINNEVWMLAIKQWNYILTHTFMIINWSIDKCAENIESPKYCAILRVFHF